MIVCSSDLAVCVSVYPLNVIYRALSASLTCKLWISCFKVRQSGLTGADMILEPQHVCHGGCPKHILRWNPDKALQYTEHLENNTEGRNSFLKAILRERT